MDIKVNFPALSERLAAVTKLNNERKPQKLSDNAKATQLEFEKELYSVCKSASICPTIFGESKAWEPHSKATPSKAPERHRNVKAPWVITVATSWQQTKGACQCTIAHLTTLSRYYEWSCREGELVSEIARLKSAEVLERIEMKRGKRSLDDLGDHWILSRTRSTAAWPHSERLDCRGDVSNKLLNFRCPGILVSLTHPAAFAPVGSFRLAAKTAKFPL